MSIERIKASTAPRSAPAWRPTRERCPSRPAERRGSRVLTHALAGLLLALAMAALDAPIASASEDPKGFETSTLQLITRDQTEHWLTVYLAISPWQRSRGLSFVEQLPPDHGMLFLFPPNRPIIMWMKDTFIPLDMVFLSADGHVLGIEENAPPGSLERIYAPAKARVVLELNGGTAARLGIKPGDRAALPSYDVQR